MTDEKRNFKDQGKLSQFEVAALAHEVLERARCALRESQDGSIAAAHAGNPAKSRFTPDQACRALALARPRFGAKLASRLHQEFEYFTIASCIILSGAACIIQSSGAYA